MNQALALLGPENKLFWAGFVLVTIFGWIIVAYLARKSFGLKLGLAFTTVSVSLTSVSVFVYYQATYESLYMATTARIKDIGRTGLFLFDEETRKTIARIDAETEVRSVKRDREFLDPIQPGNSADSLSEQDLNELQSDPGFVNLVQTLRKIKNATRNRVVLEEKLSQAPLDPNDLPVIRYANVFVPIKESPEIHYVKWIADTDFERLDANHNGKIDDDEQASPLGMIYNYADASEEIQGALKGEVTATKNYISDTYGVWISAFFPIYYHGKIIAIHSMDLDARRDVNLVRTLWLQSLGIVGLSFLISVIISFLLSKYLARPLEVLSRAASQIRARDFTARALLSRRDEFGHLTDAFNEMAAAVGQYAQTLEDRVAERTAELQQAKQETDRILATVSDGLFLLSADGRIRGNYSRALEEIFPGQDISGASLIGLLRGRIPDDKLKSAETYLNFLFDPKRPDVVLKGWNPIQRVSLNMGDLWIAASFHRIRVGDSIPELLGVFSNITESVQLEERLGEQKRRGEVQTALVLDLLRTPHALLSVFLSELAADISVLESLNSSNAPAIKRLLHAQKGNAASLKLDAFARTLHSAEDALANQADDNAAYRSSMTQLRELLAESGSLMTHIKEAGRTSEDEDFTRQAVRGVFSRRDIPVDFNFDSFDPDQFPEHARLIRDALVQFARNSAAHGVQPSDIRMAQGKPARMQIRARLEKRPGSISVHYSDDGRGLDLDSIRSQAIKLGWISDRDPFTREAAFEMIFRPGFSTASTSLEAGRGVGLDFVKDAVNRIGGTVSVNSSASLTEFRIELPLSDRN